MHKNNILVDTLRLIRTVRKRQKYRSQKAKLANLETFLDPGSMNEGFDGLGLHFCFSRCWGLCAGLQSVVPRNDTSNMAPVVLRSGSL